LYPSELCIIDFYSSTTTSASGTAGSSSCWRVRAYQQVEGLIGDRDDAMLRRAGERDACLRQVRIAVFSTAIPGRPGGVDKKSAGG
jgi:hypothetical protein